MFYAHTGEDTFWELGKRLFSDKHMSPHLLVAGFLQIGNPFFYNPDPVCFDCNSARPESRIVQLDHEAILQRGEMEIVKETAPSFVDFVRAPRFDEQRPDRRPNEALDVDAHARTPWQRVACFIAAAD